MRRLPVFVAAAAAVLTISGAPVTAQAATNCPASGNGFYVLNYGSDCSSQFGDLNSILSKLGCKTGTGTKGATTSSASGSCSQSNCLSGNCITGSDCQGGNGCKTGSSCLNGKSACITGSGCSNSSNGSSCSGNRSQTRYWR